LIRLPNASRAIAESQTIFERAELTDGEGFEWLEPELVA
jgi:hypothetical protein